ncbi:hypothetical protein KUL152_32790 [Tenacibaculum sp. KUL152]|nr:hypothetical protein KUL152_32790 [Tenacibaculum sp. KUL152]GFD94612.1 hypothetical protein KUL154_33450 [Alteromonas sp. KUL154]GFE03569.1 hypothetical protein KUL156_61610 [Alteromonas sp. KUL156]
MTVNAESLLPKVYSQITYRVTPHFNSDLILPQILNALVQSAIDEMLAAVESADKKCVKNYLNKTRGQEIKFTITMSQLEKAVDFDINNRGLIEDLLFCLGTTAVECNTINSQGVEEWAVMPVITSSKLEDNKITYCFCSELREEILISKARQL